MRTVERDGRRMTRSMEWRLAGVGFLTGVVAGALLGVCVVPSRRATAAVGIAEVEELDGWAGRALAPSGTATSRRALTAPAHPAWSAVGTR
jgi:hypothetical protein